MRPSYFGAEQLAAAQLGHDLVGEVDEAVRERHYQDIEPIGGAGRVPMRQQVGDLAAGRAQRMVMSRQRFNTRFLLQLTRMVRFFAPRHLDDDLLPALLRVG